MNLDELDKLTRTRPTVSVDDAADAFDVGPYVIRAAIKSGKIPALQIGRFVRLTSAALRQMAGLPPIGQGGNQ